jgi:hypothetical protein
MSVARARSAASHSRTRLPRLTSRAGTRDAGPFATVGSGQPWSERCRLPFWSPTSAPSMAIGEARQRVALDPQRDQPGLFQGACR